VCERVFYRHFTYMFSVKLLNNNPQIHTYIFDNLLRKMMSLVPCLVLNFLVHRWRKNIFLSNIKLLIINGNNITKIFNNSFKKL